MTTKSVASPTARTASQERAMTRRMLGMLDLTSLNDGDDEARIRDLCRRALFPGGKVAAVCVWPRFVALACAQLAGSGVRIATVVNFPDGESTATQAVLQIRRCTEEGANEIDVVFPYRRFLSGSESAGSDFVEACAASCANRAVLKVILETGQFPDEERLRRAAWIASEAGAGFLKTSTGKVGVGATTESVRILSEVAAEAGREGLRIGVKPSGGVGTRAVALSYLEIFEAANGGGSATPERFRIGASGLLNDLLGHVAAAD